MEWNEFNGQMLLPGYRVKLIPAIARSLRGEEGIIQTCKRKNYVVLFKDRPYNVNPNVIALYQKGDPKDIPQQTQPRKVVCNSDGISDCKPGDVILLFRGVFDVVEIVEIQPNKMRCKMVAGRSAGTVYIYKPDCFVQKLDKSKFLEQAAT